jgi:hypothetical protein
MYSLYFSCARDSSPDARAICRMVASGSHFQIDRQLVSMDLCVYEAVPIGIADP